MFNKRNLSPTYTTMIVASATLQTAVLGHAMNCDDDHFRKMLGAFVDDFNDFTAATGLPVAMSIKTVK